MDTKKALNNKVPFHPKWSPFSTYTRDDALGIEPGEMLYVRTSKDIKYKAKSWSDMLLGWEGRSVWHQLVRGLSCLSTASTVKRTFSCRTAAVYN